MSADFVTKEDLEAFRGALLEDIKALLANPIGIAPKPWLRGRDVKKLLGISEGSLQHLRISGKLKATRLGGIYYYQYADIDQMMRNGG
jgi:Helix-turn-helix domain